MQYEPISVIIPAYNEGETIVPVVKNLQAYLVKLGVPFEIIIVNDASTDDTKQKAESLGVRVINHVYNKGYGAGLKTGMKASAYEWLLWYDADGQFKPEYIETFLKHQPDYDFIIAERQGYQGPISRTLGKRILVKVASFLAERKINDINCGFRLVRKDKIMQFFHLYPNGFSISTTSTLAFIKSALNIKFIPIKIEERQGGVSQVKAKDGFLMLMLILRMVMLFSPLRVFLPAALVFFGLAIVSFVAEGIVNGFNLTDTTVLLAITAVLLFFFGLLADQIAALRRESANYN